MTSSVRARFSGLLVCTCEHSRTKKREGFKAALLVACVPQAITSCILDPEQGGYVISVETPVPLDLVLLHSQVHMDLLESNDEDDLGQASFESANNSSLALFGTCELLTPA